MLTSPITRRAAIAGAAAVVVSGCAADPGKAPGARRAELPAGAEPPTGSAGRRPGAGGPTTTITTAHGLGKMWPDEPLEISVENGTVGQVAVTDASGEPVPGTLTAGIWRPDRGALLVRNRYKVEVTVQDADGQTYRKTATITTVDPELVVEVDFRYADGQPIGNGMPVWVRFDMRVREDQRAAIERTASVTTTPVQEGSWGWLDDYTLQWRPRGYWAAGSTAHVEVNAAGLPAADTWVLADVAADYRYGDLRVLHADIDNHTLACWRNGELVRMLPVSMGKPGYETMTGTKLIMEKHRQVIMDSESYGVPHSDPEGYRIVANMAQRITWSGEYFHAAPWADYAHGNSNVSHGCTGLSDADAQWLFDFTLVGDPAEFTGSTFAVRPDQTYGCWTWTWDQWLAKSAVH